MGDCVYIITLYLFLHFIKDKIKKLIVSLENTRHFFLGAVSCCVLRQIGGRGGHTHLHDLL